MKRVIYLLSVLAAMLTTLTASAQDKNIFNHVAIGTEIGLTGYGFEVAAPCTRYVTFRTGFTTLPRFTIKTDVNYTTHGEKKNTDVDIRAHMTDFKLLADIYPFKHNSFHFTTGFYVGRVNLGTAHNTEPLDVRPGEGLEIGGIFVRPDENDLVRLRLQTNSFKPYVGLGFGRPISQKHRVNAAFDLGLMFWGTPKVKVYSPDEEAWIRASKEDVDDKDFHKFMKNVERFTVYPVLNFRLYYRIF